MSTIAVRRAFTVLLAMLLAVMACYTVLAHTAKAAVRPADRMNGTSVNGTQQGAEIGTAVKFVRNADGSITQTR
ncbi:MAG: hypothetical protein QOE45_2874 [Frankiaceae bacterium]|jgi:hypothetical protein|nr:hypothetical protein [Frankiaceae bacterium]